MRLGRLLLFTVLSASAVSACYRPAPVHRPRLGDQPISMTPPAVPAAEPPEPLSQEEQARSLLSEITEPLRIRLFVHTPEGDELSAELERVARSLITLAPVPGRVDVDDPIESDSAAEEARILGVRPLGMPLTRRRIEELPRDGTYRAMVVAVGRRFLVVPQVSADRGTAELQVAEAISRFLHGPRLVGMVTTTERRRDLIKLRRVFDRLDVRRVDLAAPLSEELTALIIVGPGTALAPAEAETVGTFLRSGKSVALLLDGMEVTPQAGRYQVKRARTGLEKTLRGFGIRIGRDLVFDRASARVSVPARVGRMMLPYPPIPLASVADQEVVRDARVIRLPFPSSIEVDPPPESVVTELARSSGDSWALTRRFDLNPHQQWEPSGRAGPLLLAAGVELTSGARLAVVGNARFVEDRYIDFDDNALFLRQLVEWLGGHRALTAMMYQAAEEEGEGPGGDSGAVDPGSGEDVDAGAVGPGEGPAPHPLDEDRVPGGGAGEERR